MPAKLHERNTHIVMVWASTADPGLEPGKHGTTLGITCHLYRQTPDLFDDRRFAALTGTSAFKVCVLDRGQRPDYHLCGFSMVRLGKTPRNAYDILAALCETNFLCDIDLVHTGGTKRELRDRPRDFRRAGDPLRPLVA